MFSEFQKRKMRLGFYRMDVNKDGYVDAEDMQFFGEKIAKLHGVEAGSEAYQKIVMTYNMSWQMYFLPADQDGDGKISSEEYIQAGFHYSQMDGFRENSLEQNKHMFATLDLDGDGKIQENEFSVFLRASGVHPNDAQVAFEKLDQDGDGIISDQEFAEAMFDFFGSEDPNAPGNWFFGPF